MPRPRSASRAALPLLALASVVVALLLLEVGFRLLGIRAEYPTPRIDSVSVPPGRARTPAPHGFIPYATFRSRYASDPRGYFGPGNTVDHRHSSVGWRDQEHALTRPAGTVRLLGLGDSYLWGQGVHREDVVLNRLARLLEEAHPGVPVESINTARMGSNTVDQLALLVNRGLDYQPHLVIVHFVPNDVEPDLSAQGPKLEFFREYTALYQTPDRLSEHSRLWGWLRQRAAGALRARRYVREAVASFRPENPGWRRARQALLGIRDACDRGGADLLLVIFPFFHELDGDYPFQGIHDTVRRHAETQGIAVLDLRDRYRTFRGPELWVHPTDQHPNELAHALAARAIAEYLAERAEAFPVLTAAWRAP